MTQATTTTRLIPAGTEAEVFRQHLRQVLDSATFRASRRSLEFLSHIVEKALAGHLEELKERSLGVEIFGRSPSYDTGTDAIVRVTASDVRRRLHQFYSEEGSQSDIRIELHSGSYIPEFKKLSRIEPDAIPVPAVSLAPVSLPPQAATVLSGRWRLVIFLSALTVFFAAAILWAFTRHAQQSPARALPWSALIRPDRDLRVVFCDPDISLTQQLLNFNITLPDYANQHYIPAGVKLPPELDPTVKALRGVNVASVDSAIVLNIAHLHQGSSRPLRTHTARSMHLLDFKTEDNFVILGSPRSNPWFRLFQDQLDFQFEYDAPTNQEIIRNVHPQPGEASTYIPTARGWGTGHVYAVVAFLSNPNLHGHVLLLAGSTAEATEAAGKLATDPEMIARMLKEHGINPEGAPQPFEALLRVATMAGSSDTFEVIACHRLSTR